MKGGTVKKVNGEWIPEHNPNPGDPIYMYSLHEANALNRLQAFNHRNNLDLYVNRLYWESHECQHDFWGLEYDDQKYVIDELKRAINLRNEIDGTTVDGLHVVAATDPRYTTHVEFNNFLKNTVEFLCNPSSV